MGLIFLLMLGAILGWLATIVLRPVRSDSLRINLLCGIGGALFVGLVINPLIGFGNLLHGGYRPEALLASLAGSVLFLVSGNLLRRSEMR